nr:MAG TPA: hypothetical protein [Caudoviricetes sp.]
MISKTTISELKGVRLDEILNERNYVHARIRLQNSLDTYVNANIAHIANCDTYLYVFFNPVTKKSAAVFKFMLSAYSQDISSSFSVYFPPKIIIVANETKYTIDIPYLLNRVPTYNCVYYNEYLKTRKIHNIITDHVDGKLTNDGRDLFPARLARVSSNYKKIIGSYYEVEFNVPGIPKLYFSSNYGKPFSMKGAVVYQDVVK